MPLSIIKGHYRIQGSEPDGDSVHFDPTREPKPNHGQQPTPGSRPGCRSTTDHVEGKGPR